MLPTAEPVTPAAPPRSSLRARIAARLPEIIIESLFVLVAVVLAFVVEQWREERELDRIAAEARRAIVAEVQHNRDELLESRQDTIDTISALEKALGDAAANPAALEKLNVTFELALLSSAAWTSAQSMEAARRMDYAWMLQVARAYELQAMYQKAQEAAVESSIDFKAAGNHAGRADHARMLLARMQKLFHTAQSVEDDYSTIVPATPSK